MPSNNLYLNDFLKLNPKFTFLCDEDSDSYDVLYQNNLLRGTGDVSYVIENVNTVQRDLNGEGSPIVNKRIFKINGSGKINLPKSELFFACDGIKLKEGEAGGFVLNETRFGVVHCFVSEFIVQSNSFSMTLVEV